jgi:hypothetical protein
MMGAINFDEWKRRSASALKKVHMSANDLVRRRVKMVLDEAVRVSPQWSGNYAINWGIETKAAGSWQVQKSLKVDPWTDLEKWDIGTDGKQSGSKYGDFRLSKGLAKSAGDPIALAFARKNKNYEVIAEIKWNTKVRLVNYAKVGDLIDSGEVKLRKVNLIPGNKGVAEYLKSKFPNILS